MLEAIRKKILRYQMIFVSAGFILGICIMLFGIHNFFLAYDLNLSIFSIDDLLDKNPFLGLIFLMPILIPSLLYLLMNKLKSLALEPFKELREKEIHMEMLSNFATELGKGNYDSVYEVNGDHDVLGSILLDMRDNTKQSIEKETKRNWSVSGVAKFADILRNSQDNIETLSAQLIKELVRYVNCNQGGVFLIDNSDKENIFIKASALYAYEREKHENIKLNLGEGLIGQCVYEKQHIYLTDVPTNYVNITSGLGEATPTAVLIVPILLNEDIYGAVEIISFKTFEEHEIEFIQSVASSFASTVSNVKMNENTKLLLNESRALTEEMKLKEEQMEQNAEELQATQDELSVKLQEIEEETTRTNNIVEAIDKTNAAIEYDMDGVITDVNDMFLSVTGYNKEELLGKQEEFFVAKEERESPRYSIMWTALKEGQVFSGEYKRVAKDGKLLWLTGTYNPIYNTAGEPIKIIKYAQFVTDEKEKTLDLNSKISALGQVLPIMELKPSGDIISGNALFISTFNFKRLALKKMNFTDLCANYAEIEAIDFPTIKVEEPFSRELLLRDSEDIYKYYLCHISPIVNLEGEIVKLLVILIDINGQKRLESELKQTIVEERKKNAIIQTGQADQPIEIMTVLEEIIAVVQKDSSVVNLHDYPNAMLLVTDQDGVIVMVNDSLVSKIEGDRTKLLGIPLFEVAKFDNQDTMSEVVIKAKVYQGQVKIKFEGAGEIAGEILVSPVYTDEGLRILMITK